MGNYINGAQWDVCLHALCVGSGTTSLGVRDGLIHRTPIIRYYGISMGSSRTAFSIVTSRRSARNGVFTAAAYGTRCPAHEYGTPPSVSCRIHAPGIEFHTRHRMAPP